MKKKSIALSLVLGALAIVPASAQKQSYYSDNFKDNIFLSVGVGAQACVNPDNFDYGIGKAITPAISISLGKYFTPVWGVRLNASGMWSKLYSNYGLADDQYTKLTKHFVTGRVDAIYNLTNAICGYNADRLFSLSVFAGPGLTFAKANKNEDKLRALVNGSVGLMAGFNVDKNWDINVEARGEVSPSIYPKSSASTDGAVSLLVGATYTFGGKKFATCVDQSGAIDALNNEINNYKSQLAQAEKDLADCRANQKTVEKVVENVRVLAANAFFFKIGKATLSAQDKVNVQLLAKAIKECPNHKFKLAGYADKGTGSSSLNQKLSEKRAKAVYDALVAEGVDASQLEIVANGGTANMFGKSYLNRVVIFE